MLDASYAYSGRENKARLEMSYHQSVKHMTLKRWQCSCVAWRPPVDRVQATWSGSQGRCLLLMSCGGFQGGQRRFSSSSERIFEEVLIDNASVLLNDSYVGVMSRSWIMIASIDLWQKTSGLDVLQDSHRPSLGCNFDLLHPTRHCASLLAINPWAS